MYKSSFLKYMIIGGILLCSSISLPAQRIVDLLSNVQRQEKKDTSVVSNGIKKYAEIVTREAVSVHGIMDIHRVKNSYYLEIPLYLMEKPMLLASRVSEISFNTEIIAGEMPKNPTLVEWVADEEKVYLLDGTSNNIVNPDESIAVGFARNNLKPVIYAFPIKAYNTDETAVVIDVSKFFCADEKHLSPFAASTPFDKMFGINRLKGTFKADLSGILSCRSYEKNITVKTRMAYTVNNEPFTAVMTTSMILLPDQPMRPRLEDHRLGLFSTRKTFYSENLDSSEKIAFVNRWNIQPRPEDQERYAAGEKVVPEKQIIYYVDPAFPEKWRSWLKQGIEDWQIAFEAIGFKDAIVARDYPDDPDFDPEDIRNSCLIYAAVPTANAMGPSWTDPRSGEIIQGSVYFYHDLVKLVHNWRFIQTATVDPKARKLVYDMEVMGPILRYVVAHEIGHTLGLMHNFRSSYAYPVDSLRSPKFTEEYGTTPSIMDYARYNYIAQPGDGVTQLLPPVLGVYDIFAIQWAYKPLPEARTPEEEKPILDRWIREKSDDPMYRYGMQEFMSSVDPASQSEALGDDAVKAGRYGIDNLKIVLRNLPEWTASPGDDYSYTQSMYNEIFRQFQRYMGHVNKFIGGNFLEYPVHGDGKSAFIPVSRDQMRECLEFQIREVKALPEWILDPAVIRLFDPGNDRIYDYLISVVRNLASGSQLGKVGYTAKLSDDPYTQAEYLNDLYNLVFEGSIKGNTLTWGEKRMEYAFLHTILGNLDLLKPQQQTASSARTFSLFDLREILEENMPCCLQDCGHHAHHDPVSLSASTKESDILIESKSLFMAQALKMQKLLNRRAKSAKGDMKEHYQYLSFELNKALTQ